MDQVEIELSNSLDEIPGLAETVEAFGEEHDLPAKLVFQLNLALEELVTNIVCHGYDDDGAHAIHVRLALADDMITAEVEDDGRPFDPFADAAPPDLEQNLDDRPIGGLGVHLVRSFMDEVSYRREGDRNHVRLSTRAAR
jgi:anti-sigma regulatory factor (Ser/Thr protein kinase)